MTTPHNPPSGTAGTTDTNSTHLTGPDRRSVLEELADWASALQLCDVPQRVVEFAASQILSQIAAIRVGLRQNEGKRLVGALGAPFQRDTAQSARVLAGAGAWLNLDDTAYAGHLAPSTVAVPLAFAHALRLSGHDLLRAVIVANECASRITASATLGPFRGQTALHTHLVGAVAGRLASEKAPVHQWRNALALALSAPPWTLMRGFVSSDARLLHVPVAVRMAMDACDAAAGGLTGAPDIVEHPDGFLDRFATVPLPEAVTAGLGHRWHTETLSFKLHPGGPGIDAAIDCAAELHSLMGDWSPEDVEEIVVEGSLYTLFAARKAQPYLDGPRTPLGVMVLTTPYPVATALLTGHLAIEDFCPPAVDRAERWALAAKVRLVHNASMTRALLTGDAPVGEAIRQAGDRSAEWLRAFGGDDVPDLPALLGEVGPPLEDFTQAVKPTPARVTVRMRDGRSHSRELSIPHGGIGPALRERHRALVTDKFLASGGPRDIAEAWSDLAGFGPDDLAPLIEKALTVQ
ncbi:MmgE/PrpD family protein [Streptomyces sp. NPDC053048]|uniref:MmgE/PrpD family protein n=1 Tax=Streptomyces sp. NPDC053048 TaxID=3365694 RepID=UPI0037CDA763